jgi:hypothetical protein
VKKILGITLGVMILVGLIAVPAAADPTFTTYSKPGGGDYLTSTTKIDISGLTYDSSYSSVTDAYLTVNFDTPMLKLGPVPTGWSDWASPPWSETATPHILFTYFEEDMTITLDKPCRIFGFELCPNENSTVDYDVDFILMDGSNVIGNISMTVPGDVAGDCSRLFAAKVEGASFDKIVIDCVNDDGSGFAIAQIRYDLYDEGNEYNGWVTGSGHIKDENGKKNKYSISGNAKYDEDGYLVGQVQIRDYENKMSYNLDAITSLTFSGAPTGKPESLYNTATIEASGYDKEGNPVSVTIHIVDMQEPGAGNDTVNVTGDINFLMDSIDGGNFQIHPPDEEEE